MKYLLAILPVTLLNAGPAAGPRTAQLIDTTTEQAAR